MTQVKCIWPVAAELGEGVLWSPGEQAAWFVDILGCRLHRLDTQSGERSSWPTPSRPGFLALLEGGGLLAGLADGLHRFDADDGSFSLLLPVEAKRAENRLNDGAVGPDGALWFGTKNEPETDATGSWFRWSGGGEAVTIDAGYVVTNGPAFSPDGRRLFHCDSANRRILQRDLATSGEIGENRPFATIAEGEGYPDGLAVDDEGCLWVALFAGHGVRRYSPDGEFLEQVDVPCRHVTKPAFGGADGRTLYLATAALGLPEHKRADYPDAGGLFAIEVAVGGPPLPALALQ